MKSINDLWNDVGELSDDQTLHVITRLFAIYEDEYRKNPDNPETLSFFRKLDNAITQTCECNSNRR